MHCEIRQKFSSCHCRHAVGWHAPSMVFSCLLFIGHKSCAFPSLLIGGQVDEESRQPHWWTCNSHWASPVTHGTTRAAWSRETPACFQCWWHILNVSASHSCLLTKGVKCYSNHEHYNFGWWCGSSIWLQSEQSLWLLWRLSMLWTSCGTSKLVAEGRGRMARNTAVDIFPSGILSFVIPLVNN